VPCEHNLDIILALPYFFGNIECCRICGTLNRRPHQIRIFPHNPVSTLVVKIFSHLGGLLFDRQYEIQDFYFVPRTLKDWWKIYETQGRQIIHGFKIQGGKHKDDFHGPSQF